MHSKEGGGKQGRRNLKKVRKEQHREEKRVGTIESNPIHLLCPK